MYTGILIQCRCCVFDGLPPLLYYLERKKYFRISLGIHSNCNSELNFESLLQKENNADLIFRLISYIFIIFYRQAEGSIELQLKKVSHFLPNYSLEKMGILNRR